MKETTAWLLGKLSRYQQVTAELFQGLEKRTSAEVDQTHDPKFADVDDETPENEFGIKAALTMADIDKAPLRHRD